MATSAAMATVGAAVCVGNAVSASATHLPTHGNLGPQLAMLPLVAPVGVLALGAQ